MLAASGGGSAVLVFSAIGGFTGIAALGGVIVNAYLGKRKAFVDDKSVAITELEKAVPGLGEIIDQWQTVVHQLQTDLTACRARVEQLEKQQLDGGVK